MNHYCIDNKELNNKKCKEQCAECYLLRESLIEDIESEYKCKVKLSFVDGETISKAQEQSIYALMDAIEDFRKDVNNPRITEIKF